MSLKKDLRLSSILIKWYNDNKRDLPWRNTQDPYLIWISEIILQQTRVDQGYAYYKRFAEKYPSVDMLAAAEESEVLKLWQGLGYYSRARNLHATAKTVVDKYNGVFPFHYKDVLGLKGVGEYTAAAVVSFAYNKPYAVVDGNVYRVLSRIFAIDDPIDSGKGKKVFAELSQEILDDENAGLHNQAIMEFGALQCVPVSPDCAVCPALSMCLAYGQGRVSSYPVKQGKLKTRNRYFNYFDIRCGEYMYLHKRTGKDIWQNLYELPLVEADEDLMMEKLVENEDFIDMFKNSEGVHMKYVTRVKHVLSHQVIYANFFKIDVFDISLGSSFLKIKISEVEDFPVSRLVHKYLEQL